MEALKAAMRIPYQQKNQQNEKETYGIRQKYLQIIYLITG